MASLSTGAGPPVVNVYHEKSMILPDVSRVLACLYEKNVKFETIKASYKDILSLQASRSVPVPFYDGPVFLQDSRAICRYLAETYEHQGYPFLLGKDVLERASIEQWLRNEEHAFDPPSRALFCHIAFPLHDEDDENNEDINREKRKLEEVLEVYEQRLGESNYLAGNKFTLADLVHLSGTHHVITSERFAYLYDSRKNVQKWWNMISARDSWQQVLRDMRTVEEDHRKEEHERQQQQQLQTEHLPQFGVRNTHISRQQQEGTKSQMVLVAPPSTGTIITSIPPAPREHENTTDHKPSSPVQKIQGGFFTTTEKTQPPSRQTYSTTQKPPSTVQSNKSSFFTQPSTPTTSKTQRTDVDKPNHKDASSPSKTSQISPKEAPDKPHLSDFFKVSGYKDDAGSLARPSPGSAKSPQRITEPDYSESESKPFGVRPQVDKPDTQKHQTPYGKPPEQRVTDTSVGPEAGEKQKSAKRATEADQDQAPSSRAQEVQSGVQDVQNQAKALPANQKVSGTSPLQIESEKDTQHGIDEGERFSTKRLRRMFHPDALDSQDPAMEKEAPVISEKALEATRKASDSQGTSASIQEANFDARGKQAAVGHEEIPGVRDTGDSDETQKSIIDKRTAEPTSGSQQITEPVKGVSPTPLGTPGDKSTRAATADPSAALHEPVRAPASGGQNASAVFREGNVDANGKNEEAKPSPGDPRSMLPTTPRRLAPSPDEKFRDTSGQLSNASPPVSSLSDTRNEKSVIAETSQTSVVSPNDQQGGQVTRNAGAASSVPPPVKSPEDNNKTYKEEAATQELRRDQSRAQLAGNKKQGDHAAPTTRTGKLKYEESLANAGGNNTGQAQGTANDAPFKMQIQSDQNKPQMSKDGDKQGKEITNSPSLSISKEALPSPPEMSKQEKQLQGDRSGISLQDNVKKGSEALGSVTVQQKKKDLSIKNDKNYEKTSEANPEE